jgi:uncharacterized membrane protein YoaK (UPF0700 family)
MHEKKSTDSRHKKYELIFRLLASIALKSISTSHSSPPKDHYLFQHRIDHSFPASTLFHWLLLSFLSGCMNIGGFLACGRFVTHMTGFYTLFGESAGKFQWDTVTALLCIPVFFLVGVMVAAHLVERPKHSSERPKYVFLMILIFICLIICALAGHLGYFGNFGETHLKKEFCLIALLCLASGLLNGAVSVSSGHTIRVTHMTGNTTDLGIGLIRVSSLRKNKKEFHQELLATRLRFGLITAFSLGGIVGTQVYLRFNYLGFLLPAVLILYAIFWESIWGSGAKNAKSI